MTLHKSQVKSDGLGVLVEPIFEFAVGLARLNLDKTEIALLAAVLLIQSGKIYNINLSLLCNLTLNIVFLA